MPKVTLAAWENQIRDYATANNRNFDRSEIKKLAKTISRRHENYIGTPTEDQELLAYFLDYWDETGELATDNVIAEQNAAAAARRVAA